MEFLTEIDITADCMRWRPHSWDFGAVLGSHQCYGFAFPSLACVEPCGVADLGAVLNASETCF